MHWIMLKLPKTLSMSILNEKNTLAIHENESLHLHGIFARFFFPHSELSLIKP